MKPENNDKKFDELLTGAISREKTRFDFDKWKKAHQGKIEIFKSQTTSGKAMHFAKPPNIWRTILNSKITKLAAAAVIIIAVVLGVTILDKSATPVYAIEQTIEAMRSVSSVHAYCTNWDDSKGETWVQIDPERGQEEYCYADQGNLLIVGTPQKTYFYHKDKNRVRIQKGYIPASSARISRFFEDLVTWVEQHDGEIKVNSKFNEHLQKEVIMVHVTMPVQKAEFIVRIDSQTKLPINIESVMSEPGQGVKSVDRIEYNVSIPQGIFDFEIPKGAEVVYEE